MVTMMLDKSGSVRDRYPPVWLDGDGVYAEVKAVAILSSAWDDRTRQRLRTWHCGRPPVARPMVAHCEDDLLWPSLKGKWKGLAYYGEYIRPKGGWNPHCHMDWRFCVHAGGRVRDGPMWCSRRPDRTEATSARENCGCR